jgi:putative ABC transport system permease protein
VTPKGILPFDSDASIADADAVLARIRAMPGVAKVAPTLGAQMWLARAGKPAEPLFTVGIDPRAQFLYTLTAGRDPGPGEVLVSEPMAAHDRIRPGDRLPLATGMDASLGRARGLREYRVSGIAEFVYNYQDERSLAMQIGEVRRLTNRPGQASLMAVAALPGVSDDSLARRISAAIPAVSAYSTRELMGEMDKRLLYFRQLATILGSIAVVVTALLVSTIVTIGVRERFGEIATLRAVGIPRRRILAGIVAEGLAMAGIGCAVGLPLGLWMAGRLDRILLAFPGLPAGLTFFAWNPTRVAAAMLTVAAIGAAAGCLPGWSAVTAPLGRALREEAE